MWGLDSSFGFEGSGKGEGKKKVGLEVCRKVLYDLSVVVVWKWQKMQQNLEEASDCDPEVTH